MSFIGRMRNYNYFFERRELDDNEEEPFEYLEKKKNYCSAPVA